VHFSYISNVVRSILTPVGIYDIYEAEKASSEAR
jgi:hypothetical protein